MLRTFTVLAAAGLVLGSTSAVAVAQPDQPACNYNLTPPTVVNLSGTDVVTATVSVGACDGAVTFQTVACLQMQGGSQNQCARGNGLLPAQVFYQPYHPGATYTASGRGCASKGNPPEKFCQEKGPLTATL
ncbi:MAG: hypothetical protein AB7G47_03855 [Mycolicibacterium sp.]|uniref:hypothetical protein n=1 Tax=Mycolicibacterium sp. TaxID=2320850 RepID=UPI003D0AB36C